GAAELAEDHQLSQTLTTLVKKLITDQQRLKKMQKEALKLAHPDADRTIAKKILALIKQK
ncbi:MAG TPA: hypothetical protein VK112_12290, partial [Fodinibius sp.]|nr:hypothetical protein [Fodinibius sp.]